MDKRFWVCGLVVAMAALLSGFLVHGVVLRGDYLALAPLYRSQPEANARFGWIVAAYLLIGFSMTWLYRRLHDTEEVRFGTGLRFGIAVALVSFVPWHLLAYVGQPLPLSLMLRQVAFDFVAMATLGMLLAWLRPGRVALTLPSGER
ncbi:hypothetical protein QFW77_13725 [Luteimonas sp. RD2P54]|uniref:Uncharacterized protein n=1 Tax=Luteimonas endophytica TaxID=3042023 RepID=A0ABT6JB39_9GAMM|nr:hypothetical protein [Luteimonas endophytica]MDH5824037.1 hypothetical protein [Luteimonas endophytica]